MRPFSVTKTNKYWRNVKYGVNIISSLVLVQVLENIIIKLLCRDLNFKVQLLWKNMMSYSNKRVKKKVFSARCEQRRRGIEGVCRGLTFNNDRNAHQLSTAISKVLALSVLLFEGDVSYAFSFEIDILFDFRANKFKLCFKTKKY